MSKSGLVHGDGQPFNPDRFKRELQEGVMKAATSHVEKVVQGILSPVHHQRPTVTRTATGWEIHGCCEQIREEARKAFGH